PQASSGIKLCSCGYAPRITPSIPTRAEFALVSPSIGSRPLCSRFQGEFNGRCILYGSVLYNGTLRLSTSSNISLCYFVSSISVLTALYCFLMLLYNIYSACVEERRRRAWLSVSLAVSALILFFLLVSACVLRVGMDTLCTSIVQSTAAHR
uniref:Transmembrane protein 179B n=1 Tax=Sphenodon punctatus TaxID=8508 RepID=A0A8D0GCG9_SPHPU